MNSNTVYFIYTSNRLPKYAIASIKLAKKMSGMKIHLIGNFKFKNQITKLKINFTSIENFYDPKRFEDALKNTRIDKNFRDGFWVKTLERLFILEQFMIKKKIKSIFHSEIDQLLFRTDKLVEAICKTKKKGLFVPFHNKKNAIASVLFVNELSALKSLNQEAGSGTNYLNEMQLIAKWSKKNPKKIFALPTLATEIKRRANILPKNLRSLSSKEIDGIVDAAQLGQWVGGIDPKNVSIFNTLRTKFVDKPKKWLLSYSDLKKMKFKQIHDDNNKLFLKFKKRNYQVYNLHLHSKIHHNIFYKKPSLFSLISNSNSLQSMRLKGTKIIQLQYFVLTYFYIFKKYLKNPSKIYMFFKKRLLNDL